MFTHTHTHTLSVSVFVRVICVCVCVCVCVHASRVKRAQFGQILNFIQWIFHFTHAMHTALGKRKKKKEKKRKKAPTNGPTNLKYTCVHKFKLQSPFTTKALCGLTSSNTITEISPRGYSPALRPPHAWHFITGWIEGLRCWRRQRTGTLSLLVLTWPDSWGCGPVCAATKEKGVVATWGNVFTLPAINWS